MRKVIYLACVLVLALPFTLTARDVEDNGPGSTAVYNRADSDCTGYEGCEKTYCTAGGNELCSPQYCNYKNCGPAAP